MTIKNLIIDNIQYILTVCIFLISTYSSIFVKHNQVTYIILSIIAVQSIMILSNKTIFSKQTKKKDTLILDESIEKKNQSHKSNKLNWLKNDKLLYDLCQEVKSINKINKNIYNTICDKMNKISRKYYKELKKNDKNMYNNIEKHKRPIQFIEDSVKDIIELFKEIEFSTTNNKYLYEYNIPKKIDRFKNIMHERIELLKHKRNLR